MSFSVQRHRGDDRRLGQFAPPLMALVDMIAEKDWDRAAKLAEGIMLDCHVEAIETENAEMLKAETLKR